VVGISDKILPERLQMEPELTLEKAKHLIRQKGAVWELGSVLKNSKEAESTLDRVASASSGRRKQQPGFRRSSSQFQRQRQVSHTGNRCKRCGGKSHPIQQCPARDIICFKCNRKGHFKKHCISKTVAAITEDTAQLELQGAEGEPDFYLDTTSTEGAEKLWRIEVLINKKKVQFKVDTGAEVTAI